jgi:hypothetical protein
LFPGATEQQQALQRIHERISVPPEVKWDLWLGPAPERPYHPIYLPSWRAIAIRHKGKLLHFDARSRQFLNADSANDMFASSYRSGWSLPT